MDKNELDHNIRNPILGIYSEIKKLMISLVRMENHIKRIDTAREETLKKWVNESK